MTFPELKDFLMNKMRMSHIYQPVMLISLLKNGGVSSIESVAKDLLINDQSQMEYYDKVTKNMVGKVLTKNNVVKKEGNSFNLLDFESYSEKERNELINNVRTNSTITLKREERESFSIEGNHLDIYLDQFDIRF